MTEDNSANTEAPSENSYETLLKETQEQISSLKSSFEATNKKNEELIASLKADNEALQRALVRSAVSDPPKQAEKTEADLYNEEVTRLAEKTREYMRNAH